jgi:hypothetical protein
MTCKCSNEYLILTAIRGSNCHREVPHPAATSPFWRRVAGYTRLDAYAFSRFFQAYFCSFDTYPFSPPIYHLQPLPVQSRDPSFMDASHARLSPDKNNRRHCSCSFTGNSIITVLPSPINTNVPPPPHPG